MPSTPSGTWAVDELEKRLPEDDIKTYGDFRAVTKLDAGIILSPVQFRVAD
jgi:hypothetical protein